MKEIKDDINRWRDIMFLGRKNQDCENDYTTKCSWQIKCDPIKLPMTFFTELEQKFHNSYGNTKDPE